MESSQRSRASIFESINRKTFFPSIPAVQSLPVFKTESTDPQQSGGAGAGAGAGLRRRLSSLSLKIRPSYSYSADSWALRRSKSVSAIGEVAGTSLRKWWDWGWTWIMSRKPNFARDLEMNDEETAMLGCHTRGSWRHVFYKVRSEIRKIVGPGRLPTTQKFGYDSISYAQNFDDGKRYEG